VFVEDVSIPEKFRARLKDYFRSGYDRGHQVYPPLLDIKVNEKVPAADAKFSQVAMNETFYLTNICPQVRHLANPQTNFRSAMDSIEIVLSRPYRTTNS
jgi:DNA/RNA endonuclease G (NUC1)